MMDNLEKAQATLVMLGEFYQFGNPYTSDFQIKLWEDATSIYSIDEIKLAILYMNKGNAPKHFPNSSEFVNLIKSGRSEFNKTPTGTALGSNDEAAIKRMGFNSTEEYLAKASDAVIQLSAVSKFTSRRALTLNSALEEAKKEQFKSQAERISDLNNLLAGTKLISGGGKPE